MTRSDTSDQPTRHRQPMTWPLAAFGLGVLAFLAVVVWLVTELIRDLAG